MNIKPLAPEEYTEEEIKNRISFERKFVLNATSMVNSHFHKYYEIYYLVKGERNYIINDELHYVCTRDLVLIPKHTLHRTVSFEGSEYERILIFIHDKHLTDDIRSIFDNYIYHIPVEHSDTVIKMLMDIEKESKNQDEYRENLMQYKIYSLFVFILRMKIGSVNQLNNNYSDYRVNEAISYINANFDKDISLEDVAKPLSKEYFCILFKKETGFGFNEYLNQVRIFNAMQLLKNPDIDIITVAHNCGFNDSSYFAVIFKKITGTTPKKYQKSLAH